MKVMTPSEWVRWLQLQGPEVGLRVFAGWSHRFNVGEDLVVLFWLIGRSWREFGSVGAHFLNGMSNEDVHIGPALDRLIKDWRRWAAEVSSQLPRLPARDSFSYLLTAPEDGSCCKRWCMLQVDGPTRWLGSGPLDGRESP